MTITGDADDSLVVTLARSQGQREAYRDFVFARGEDDERQYRRRHTPKVRWSSGFATMTETEYEQNLEKLYLAPPQRDPQTSRVYVRERARPHSSIRLGDPPPLLEYARPFG